VVFLCKKANFARTQNLPFCWLCKRQNTRPLQAALARLSIATKRQQTNKVAYEIRVALKGNQLKRLNTSLRPQALIDYRFSKGVWW
jgi:hypothetical protein